MFKRLHPLFEMEGDIGSEAGVEVVPAAEVPQDPGVDSQAAAEPKDNNFEKAFAKRLSAKEAEWQAKLQEVEGKYKDYDDLKQVADYFRELNQAPDVMTLKEKIEMERLQQRAEEQGISPELQKRLEYLEQRDKAAQELEQKIQQEEQTRREQEEGQKAYQEFRGKLDTFAKEKGADGDQLYAFMVENQIGNMEAALKAMRHDDLEQKLADAEKEGVRKFMQSKSKIPNVPGTTQSATKVQAAPKTFAEARARAMQRLSGE